MLRGMALKRTQIKRLMLQVERDLLEQGHLRMALTADVTNCRTRQDRQESDKYSRRITAGSKDPTESDEGPVLADRD